MARKKIDPPIEGFGKDPELKLTVQKSIPLFSLWRSDLTLAEFKILDTYLSRINSHEPEKRAVIFTKGELENLLGLTQIKPDVLDERLKHLMETTVSLAPKGSKKVDRITLFERGQAEQDDFGQWTAQLTCTPAAMKYIFNIEKLGYLRYKLRSITSLTSRYTYILFLYLEHNRIRKEWEVEVDTLRQILNCDQDELYKEFKRFNERILKRCQKELLEKTECRFAYEPVKKGRKVVAVRFTLETLADILPEAEDELDGQMQLPWHEQDLDDPLALLSGACDNEFSREEMTVILEVLRGKHIPEDQYGIETARYHYLRQRYAQMNLRDATKKIQHRHSYLVKMLKNED